MLFITAVLRYRCLGGCSIAAMCLCYLGEPCHDCYRRYPVQHSCSCLVINASPGLGLCMGRHMRGCFGCRGEEYDEYDRSWMPAHNQWLMTPACIAPKQQAYIQLTALLWSPKDASLLRMTNIHQVIESMRTWIC